MSSAARASEKAGAGLVETTWTLAGSLDGPTAELVLLEAVMLAEAKDLANWHLLEALGQQMAPGEVRDLTTTTVDDVLRQEIEHHGWAAETRMAMLFGLATGGLAPPTAEAADSSTAEVIDLDAMTKEDLYASAQALEIEGRSSMSKEELAEAIKAKGGAR